MKQKDIKQLNNWRCAHVAWLLIKLTAAAENSQMPLQTLRQIDLSQLRCRNNQLQLIHSKHPLVRLVSINSSRIRKNPAETLPTQAFAKRLYKRQLPGLLKQPGCYQLLTEAITDTEALQKRLTGNSATPLAQNTQRYSTTTLLTAEISARITPLKPDWVEKLPCLSSSLLH